MSQKSALIIGSGLAGLTTAHLLTPHYRTTIFECSPVPSLDAASHTLPSGKRVDIPMRAFTPSYYPRLTALYAYLGLPTSINSLTLTFPTFHYPAALSRFPPKPTNRTWLSHLGLLFALGWAYFYYTISVSLLPPHPTETLETWLKRLHIPQWFVKEYLIPALAAVTTCSYDSLLSFPATDVTTYQRLSHGEPHHVITGGVSKVQSSLLSSGAKILFNRLVTSISEDNVVTWTDSTGAEFSDKWDIVVLAVPPDVVGRIFSRLQTQMAMIPTTVVEVITHTDLVEGMRLGVENEVILTSKNGWTESALWTGGAWITTCPHAQPREETVLKRTKFTRVLRSLESQRVVNSLFQHSGPEDKRWRNGEGGVFLVGGWCWDGMVLLEGCIESAERVAVELGIPVPW